jgi:hypothetical protein
MGYQEGKEDVDRMKWIAEKIGKNSNCMIYSVIDPDGKHNEQAWRKWFAEFYKWMMADGFNILGKSERLDFITHAAKGKLCIWKNGSGF